MLGKIVVLSTCGSAEEAEKIARTLVGKRVAACVNVVPGVRSFYWWQGKIEDSAEYMLVIKTRGELFERLKAELTAVHSYEVPEIVALQIADGAENYLNWIEAETRCEP